MSSLSFSLQPSAAPHPLLSTDQYLKVLKYHNKSAHMGWLTSHKALRLTPFRKRKRSNYMLKLNKLRIITESTNTGSPPATPFNSTTFLMGLQQLRELENSPHLKFDQYGSMDNLLACWPLAEPPPNQAEFINDGHKLVEDVFIASSSPTARSGYYCAISEHGVIASSCDSMEEDNCLIQKTRDSIVVNCVYDQECSSKDVLSSSSIQLCSSDNPILQGFSLEREMEGSDVLHCSSDQSDGQNSGVPHSL